MKSGPPHGHPRRRMMWLPESESTMSLSFARNTRCDGVNCEERVRMSAPGTTADAQCSAAPKRLAVDCQRLTLDTQRQYAALQIKFDVSRFGVLADWHRNCARLRCVHKRETSGCGSCSAAAEAQNIGRARCWRIGGETWCNGEGRRAGHERHEQGNHGDVTSLWRRAGHYTA